MNKINLTQISDIDIRHLHIFRAVVNAGGIAAAEMDLNIGSSTISRHLKELESRFGLILCHRGRGGFSLTAEGETVYESSTVLINAMDSFRDEVNKANDRIKGKLLIAIFDKLATNKNCKLDKIINSFISKAPDVSLEIHTLSLNNIEKGIINGLYQIGIVPEYIASPSIEYIPLFKEHVSLYCGEKHKLFEQESIKEEDVLNLKYAGLGYHSPSVHKASELNLKRYATAFDQEGITILILSGCYVGYLPDHYAESFVKDGRIKKIQIKNSDYNCQFSAIYRKSPKPNRALKLFLKTLSTT